MCVCVCACVCMHVCTYACMHMCVHVRLCMSMRDCVHPSVCVYACVRERECVCVCACTYTLVPIFSLFLFGNHLSVTFTLCFVSVPGIYTAKPLSGCRIWWRVLGGYRHVTQTLMKELVCISLYVWCWKDGKPVK